MYGVGSFHGEDGGKMLDLITETKAARLSKSGFLVPGPLSITIG